jgi:uncharacterized membrane protein YphA (DoxX/SURF4 family)
LLTYLALSSRFALGLVFILAGISKAWSPSSFERALRKYDFLPLALNRPVAFALPPLEIVAGLMLTLGVATAWVALFVAAALIAFSLIIGRALIQRKVIDCGCFGPTAPKRITWWSMARNAFLLAMAVLVVFVAPPIFSIAPATLMSSALRDLPGDSGLPIFIASTMATLGAMIASDMTRAQMAVRAMDQGGGSP